MNEKSIEQKVKRLGAIFSAMVENYNTFDSVWKNISLAREAFTIMKELPMVVEGEYATPVEKASILSQMLDQMEETLTPRFCIEVREYIHSLNADDESNNEELTQLRDFIDESFPMEEYCKKYSKILKFDPIERTQKWEDVIYDVEQECAEILKDEPKGMGFCFSYWSTKRSVLEKYGISWKSPGSMNPRVMFD
ncbi:MAG: hypothetical protein E7080_04395 [Bacteroidales bacterium]|nr:hypothetical protein [Bacteroidales bacterium]